MIRPQGVAVDPELVPSVSLDLDPKRAGRRFAGRAGGPAGGFQRPEPDPRNMGGGQCADNKYNCADTPNPLPEAETLWIERMTWMDVRDALADGKATAIISTGGLGRNGPRRNKPRARRPCI